MADTITDKPPKPAWSAWVGIIIIVLGVYLTASHGNELMKHAVMDGKASVEIEGFQHDCPEDELKEEGISLAMCRQATFNTDSVLLSRPDWFRTSQLILMSFGTVLAFSSIFVGVGLVEYRLWAPMAATVVIGGLLAIDVVNFFTVVYAGPIIRQLYLWIILMWFFIHGVLLAAIMAGIHEDKNTSVGNEQG
ncbi:MAG: hypothetical protein AAF410_04165 [Pseudomonadota bacterium]